MKLVVANDTKFTGVFGIIRETDGVHPIIEVDIELENAFNNRMKRIQPDTREVKKENLLKSYLAFERKMMYVVSLAVIQKAKEWCESITFLMQPDIEERFLSTQTQLEKSLQTQCRKYNVHLETKALDNSKLANFAELNGNWGYDYRDLIIIARRLNEKVNVNAPFVPWGVSSYSVDETENEMQIRPMSNKMP